MQRENKLNLLGVLSLIIALFLALSSSFSLGVVALAESSVKEITVFSWEDYIDEGYESAADEASDVLLDRFSEEDLEMSVIDVFERENPDIKVNYYSFATNEEMYNELLKDPDAVDLICPSEYMIMKMRNEGLIKPYTMPQNYAEYGSPYIKGVFDELGLNTSDGKAYATGYMWGTMGLIYNAEKFTDEDFVSWSNLYDEKFNGKITIKDSLRDSYIMAIAIVYKDELLQLKTALNDGTILDYNGDGKGDAEDYEVKLFEIFNRTDEQTVDKVGNALIELKGNLYGFEVDAGKNDLLTGKIDVNFAWSGDAVYSMWEADESGLELRYVVPEEGSNVWFDGWVMTKDADEESSLKFLDFLARPDVAIRNMDYVGYTSCIGGDEVFSYIYDNFNEEYLPEATLTTSEFEELSNEEKAEYAFFDGGYALKDDGYAKIIDDNGKYLSYFTLDESGNEVETERKEAYENDLKYFFEPQDDSGSYIIFTTETSRHLYAQYADEQTILRCAVMDNFSVEDLELVNEMWNKVKLITLSDTVLIVTVVVIAIAILGFVLFKFKDKLFVGKVPTADSKSKKNNLKIVKVEEI